MEIKAIRPLVVQMRPYSGTQNIALVYHFQRPGSEIWLRRGAAAQIGGLIQNSNL